MKWLNKVIEAQPRPTKLFAEVDPAIYFEWRFTGQPPSDIKPSPTRPPVTGITSRKMIVAWDPVEGVAAKPQAVAGVTKTESEVLDDYTKEIENWGKILESFQRECITKGFMIVPVGDKEKIMRVGQGVIGTAHLDDFGPVPEFIKQIRVARNSLQKAGTQRQGRAHETELYHRMDNICTTLSNKQPSMDKYKLEFAIRTANIRPMATFQIPWKDLLLKCRQEAKLALVNLEKTGSLKWVQEALQKRSDRNRVNG